VRPSSVSLTCLLVYFSFDKKEKRGAEHPPEGHLSWLVTKTFFNWVYLIRDSAH